MAALVALALGARPALPGVGTLGAQDAAVAAPQASAPIASLDTAWNAIARTYWDTVLVQGRWRAAYDSIRAAVPEGADDDRVRRAIRALIAVPGVSHFALIPGSAVPEPPAAGDDRRPDADTGPGTTGVVVRTIGDTLVAWRVTPGGPAARAGLRPGDVITTLDTLSIDSLRTRLTRVADSDPTTVRRLLATFVLARLAGDTGDSVRLGFLDARGREHAAWLVREPMTGRLTQMGNLPPMVVSASRDSLRIARGRFATVITFSTWLPAIAPELDGYFFASRRSAGLIIDLRGNPGGVVGMVAGISGHLLDTAIALGTMHGRGATIRFVANPRRVDRTGARTAPYAGPLAILVDDFTGSTSEFFAAGMQSIGRARIFGDRSAGQSLPALLSRLPNGDVLMHAIADHEDAAGRRVEGVGVIPDEPVPLRRPDLRAGRDAPLEAARAWIAAQPVTPPAR